MAIISSIRKEPEASEDHLGTMHVCMHVCMCVSVCVCLRAHWGNMELGCENIRKTDVGNIENKAYLPNLA